MALYLPIYYQFKKYSKVTDYNPNDIIIIVITQSDRRWRMPVKSAIVCLRIHALLIQSHNLTLTFRQVWRTIVFVLAGRSKLSKSKTLKIALNLTSRALWIKHFCYWKNGTRLTRLGWQRNLKGVVTGHCQGWIMLCCLFISLSVRKLVTGTLFSFTFVSYALCMSNKLLFQCGF